MKTKLSPESRAKLAHAAKERWAKRASAAPAVKQQTTDANSPRNRAQNGRATTTVQEVSAQLDELMSRAIAAAGCKTAGEFALLPKEERNAFLAQARGLEKNPARDTEAGLRQLDPQTIRRSPFNRETFDQAKLDELIADVKLRGVLQPGCVRPVRDGGKIAWEIIYGERRWLAARAAGRLYPAQVRDAGDTEAIELQAIENFEREDLNAMDEAVKYAQLTAAYQSEGLSATAAVERIEAKVHRGKSTVYALLALTKLPPAVQAAVRAGRLPKSHAELLGKIDDPKAAEKLCAEILKPDRWSEENGVLSFRETKRRVDTEIERQSQVAEYEKLKVKFAAARDLVLSDKENKALFHSYGSMKSEGKFVDEKATHPRDTQGRSYGVLMGKHTASPVLARKPDGSPVILFAKTDADAAVKKAGKLKARAKLGSFFALMAQLRAGKHKARAKLGHERKETAEEIRRRERCAKRTAAFAVKCADLVKDVEAGGETERLWRALAGHLVEDCRDGECVARRRGLTGADNKGWEQALAKLIATAPAKVLRGLVVEMILTEHAPSTWSGDGWEKGFGEALKLWRGEVQSSGKGKG